MRSAIHREHLTATVHWPGHAHLTGARTIPAFPLMCRGDESSRAAGRVAAVGGFVTVRYSSDLHISLTYLRIHSRMSELLGDQLLVFLMNAGCWFISVVVVLAV